MIIVAVLLAVCAIAIAIFAILCFTDKLPGNAYVGIRTRETAHAPEIWNAAHKTAAPLSGVAAVIFLVGSSLTAIFRDNWILALATTVITIVAGLMTLSYSLFLGARTAALLAPRPEEQPSSGGCGTCSHDSEHRETHRI